MNAALREPNGGWPTASGQLGLIGNRRQLEPILRPVGGIRHCVAAVFGGRAVS
jgi:hypothetical protein